jgi:beta-lactamase class A
MVELTAYSRQRGSYPAGLTIAGVPVGGVSPEEAAQRLLQVYNSPVEMKINDQVIMVDPTIAGFELNIESMLAAADLQRTGSSFWGGFWDFLWNRDTVTQNVPLVADFSEDRLREYLTKEIASRYDQPAVAAIPLPGQTNFQPGANGMQIDIDNSVTLLEDALRSPNNRSVALTMQRTAPARPSLQNLEILIKQIIDLTPFDGVVGFYMLDLQTGEELHFGYNQNNPLSVETDIAFTASSTIKIPILVSVYRNLGPQLDKNTSDLVLEMITKSENPASDALMNLIAPNRGPLKVTEDMRGIGLQNTFLAGYFFDGAPLLEVIKTPSNERFDINTSPDMYNQTTPSEMGTLLADIYQCSQTNGGGLVAAFPDKFNAQVCQQIIDYLKRDKIGVLIEAGVPEGTQVAHKHGWISGPSGIIQNISDVGIIYTPGGNFVLAIYVYHPVQAVWEPVSNMVSQITQAVYNYFNLQVR